MTAIKQAIEALKLAIETSYSESNNVMFNAALAALRSMPAEPYAYAVYFPDQPTEELVHDLDELLEDMTNREHTITELFATPPTAPVLLTDAEIDAITVAQWGDRVLLGAYRAYARAIEQSVIARVGRGEL